MYFADTLNSTEKPEINEENEIKPSESSRKGKEVIRIIEPEQLQSERINLIAYSPTREEYEEYFQSFETIVRRSKIGFEQGCVRPEMIPEYLVNTPWWTEPSKVQYENNTQQTQLSNMSQHYLKVPPKELN